MNQLIKAGLKTLPSYSFLHFNDQHDASDPLSHSSHSRNPFMPHRSLLSRGLATRAGAASNGGLISGLLPTCIQCVPLKFIKSLPLTGFDSLNHSYYAEKPIRGQRKHSYAFAWEKHDFSIVIRPKPMIHQKVWAEYTYHEYN